MEEGPFSPKRTRFLYDVPPTFTEIDMPGRPEVQRGEVAILHRVDQG